MKALDTEYQYLLDSRNLYLPRSQAAALTGVAAGFLPEAALVFQGVNVRPIFEEPYDLLELEKVLAKPDLGLETIELLMKIFSLMTKNPDKEVALFAAESINALELRCGKFIQGIKREFNEGRGTATARRLFEALYGMGVINNDRPVLKRFYLVESLGVLDQLWALSGDDATDVPLAVRVHLELDQPDEAEALLERFIDARPHDAHLYFLMARVKFHRGDYLQVMALLQLLKGNAMVPEADEIFRFWTGADRG
jgi:tetratricopeptide (TPR) repeat protein